MSPIRCTKKQGGESACFRRHHENKHLLIT